MKTSSWTEDHLKNPEKFYEMTVLLNAQREIADKILDAQWETTWRQEKVAKIFVLFPRINIHFGCAAISLNLYNSII